jgi:prepilin-type N-terminal cleavage/methylation domain-containing protein
MKNGHAKSSAFRRAGFTLIELMVSVAIGIMLVGIGVVSMNGFLGREHLSTARNEVMSAIKLARNYAITTQKPAGFAPQLDYVAVTIDASGQLSILAGNVSSGAGTSYLTKNVNKDGAVSTIVGTLLFSVPEGKLLANGSTPAASDYVVTVTISSAEVADIMTVSVDAGGRIW